MIFKPIVPLEDEYLPSIIERFYLNLGFKDAKAFRSFVYGIRYLSNSYYPSDYPQTKIFEMLGFKNFYDIILKHTEYPFIAPLSGKIDQLRFIGKMFELKGFSLKNVFPELKRCPECDKEKSYIRRSHNLPGVTVCYKHKCSLMVDGDEVNTHITQNDIKYAIYAKEFTETCFDFSLVEFQSLVGKMKSGNNKMFLPQRLETVMNKFPSVKDIRLSVPKPIIDTDQFEVIYISNNIIELVCKKCGTHFCTTYFGYENDFLCPKCQSKFSDDELFTLKLNKLTNGEFVKVSQNISISNQIIMFHVNCKKLFFTIPYDFLENPVCPQCENKMHNYRKDLLQDYNIVAYVKKTQNFTIENKYTWQRKEVSITELETLVTENRTSFSWTPEKVNEELSKSGFKMVTAYSGYCEKMGIVCENGHEKYRTFVCFLRSPVCQECKAIESKSGSIKVLNYLKANFKQNEIFKLEDITDLTIAAEFRKEHIHLAETGDVYSVSPKFYSFKPGKLKAPEIIEQYYVNGYKYHGFYVRFSFWNNIGFKIVGKKTIYLCTTAVNKPTQVEITKKVIKMFPMPSYYTKEKEKESQLIFSLNSLGNMTRFKTEDKEIILKLSSKYAKENGLDLAFINKYCEVKFNEKQI